MCWAYNINFTPLSLSICHYHFSCPSLPSFVHHAYPFRKLYNFINCNNPYHSSNTFFMPSNIRWYACNKREILVIFDNPKDTNIVAKHHHVAIVFKNLLLLLVLDFLLSKIVCNGKIERQVEEVKKTEKNQRREYIKIVTKVAAKTTATKYSPHNLW